MKRRLLSIILCLVLVITLLPFTVSAEDSGTNVITNPAPVTDAASGNLNLTKNLTKGQNGYDITMESYSTGEVNSFTEKVPTDFVVVVDQSGSMSTTDMPSGYTTASSTYLETIAESSSGYYYLDPDSGNYYRVYPVKGYLYEYFAENTKWTKNIVDESNAGLRWFQSENEATFDVANQYYYKTDDGVYRPVTVTIEGKVGTYYVKLRYTDASGNEVYFDRRNSSGQDRPVYKNALGSGKYSPGDFGYNAINATVTAAYPTKTAYTYSTFAGVTTGMYINYPMYVRHVGYTELRYRDVDGVEHTVPASNGSSTWEYCNSSSQAITTYDGSTRPTYSGLYTESGTNKSRLSALKEALNQFADAVANETDSFGSVDNKISIMGFSSSGYNNTELLTGDNVTISSNNGVQKATADNNESYYYGTALVDSTDGNVGTVNSQITDAIDAITASGGTQPEDGLNMAYKVLTNRSNTTYTVRSGENKGSTVDRNTIVIFFTDGHPGDYDYVDMYSEANDVVEAAKPIKDYGTSLFSIGVFGESDGNPLTYPAHDVTSEDGDYEYELGWMETVTYTSWLTTHYAYLNRNWLPNNTDDYGSTANDTIFDYMSVVSSNYPDAEKFMNVDSTGLADTTGYSNYLAMCNDVRSTNTAESTNKYYRMASNQDTLVAAFLQAVTMMNEESSTGATLDSTAIFKDTVNLDDFDISNATYTVQWQPITLSNDEIVETGTTTTKVASTAVPATGEITYTGFDYSNYYVATGHDGQKLIVTISGLTPKRVSKTLTSNDGEAGIYGPNDDDATVSIASPTMDNTNEKFYVVEKLIKSDGTTETSEAQKFTFADYYDEDEDTVSFDLTGEEVVSSGYMYGGHYDSTYTTPSTVCGLDLYPEIGKTYYVKSVAKTYLFVRNVHLERYGNVLGTYGITVTDDNKYNEVGFIYSGSEDPIPTMSHTDKETGETESSLYSQVEFKYVNDDDPYTPQSIYSKTETVSSDAKLAVARLDSSANGTVQAYWITPDNVLVKGDNIRTLDKGKKDKDVENSSSASKAPSQVEYDGAMPVNILFVGNEDEEETIITDDNVKLAGYTTSLNGKIEMNFYLELAEDVAADEDAYLQFTLPGTNHTEETVKLADARKQTRSGKTYYVFSAGVAAKDMTSDIKAQFVQGDGTKSEEWTYTIKAYCDYVRNHPDAYDAESIALVENMLNYGGYAQTYFKYNTEKLANADLDLDLPDVALDDSFDPVLTGELDGLTYLGSSAMLTTTTGLRHYFSFDGDAEDYTFKANGETLEVQSSGENSYVLIDNISAKDLPTAITLTVTDKDGNEMTLAYSVYTNIKQVVGSDSFTETSQNLMRALYGYGEAAKAYFATR